MIYVQYSSTGSHNRMMGPIACMKQSGAKVDGTHNLWHVAAATELLGEADQSPMLALTPLVTMAAFHLSRKMTPDPGFLEWEAARDHCATRGMELAVISTAAEQAALNEALRLYEAERGAKWHGIHCWIGAHSSSINPDFSSAADFSWHDGTRIGSFANWREGTPNGPGQCVSVYWNKGQYVWNNAACAGTRSFACSDGLSHPPVAPLPPASPSPPPSPPLLSTSTSSEATIIAIAASVAAFILFSGFALVGARRYQRRATSPAQAGHELSASAPVQQAIAVEQPDGRPAVALGKVEPPVC